MNCIKLYSNKIKFSINFIGIHKEKTISNLNSQLVIDANL